MTVPRKAKQPKRALVIVAHPDDAEFLCGGTIAKLCAEGWEVSYLLTTSGDMGSRDEKMSRPALSAIREKEQVAAANALGVKEVVFLRYPDGFYEDTAEARGRIVREVRRLKPDLVITWDPFRRTFTHRDHRLTGQSALDAIYPLARNPLGYAEHFLEGLDVHRVNEVWLAGSADPDHYVDVTDHFETKIKSLRQHKSQIGQAPLRELKKRLRERMRETAKEQEFELGEAFRRLSWG
jgi:LmbE family N-acetylglucosaminyl deacetylase